MSTPTYAEINEQVKRIEQALGGELVLDTDNGALRQATTGAALIDLTGLSKQRILTTLKRAAEEAERELGPAQIAIDPILDHVETPDVDVDTMSTWEEKAEALDLIVDILDRGDWSTSTLAEVAKVIVDAGYATAEAGRFRGLR